MERTAIVDAAVAEVVGAESEERALEETAAIFVVEVAVSMFVVSLVK